MAKVTKTVTVGDEEEGIAKVAELNATCPVKDGKVVGGFKVYKVVCPNGIEAGTERFVVGKSANAATQHAATELGLAAERKTSNRKKKEKPAVAEYLKQLSDSEFDQLAKLVAARVKE